MVKYLQLTILFIVFASCSKDEIEHQNGYAPSYAELAGKWYTTKVKIANKFMTNIDSCNLNSYIQFETQGQYADENQCTGLGFIGRFTLDNNMITCTDNRGIVTYKVLHFKGDDAILYKTDFNGAETEFQIERR